MWGDADPIGLRVTLPLESKTVTERVIGIVGDVKQGELADATVPTVYEYTRAHSWNSLSFVMRTSAPPVSAAPSATGAIRALDAQQPVETSGRWTRCSTTR